MANRLPRHRAQAGTTLVELLVCTVIMSLALVLLIGLFSTGAVDSTMTKRDVSAQAATEYELDRINAMPFDSSAAPYSECFTSDGGNTTVVVYQGSCPTSTRIRADVAASLIQTNLQQWTIVVNGWPAPRPIGKPVSTYKVKR